ncbi:MAG: FmdB family zinc ribbon protein [Pirellulales bacterium]
MPLYEYTCSDCTAKSEILIRGSETPQCPQCESTNLERAWSVPAAHSGSRAAELPISGCGKPACCRGQCS